MERIAKFEKVSLKQFLEGAKEFLPTLNEEYLFKAGKKCSKP